MCGELFELFFVQSREDVEARHFDRVEHRGELKQRAAARVDAQVPEFEKVVLPGAASDRQVRKFERPRPGAERHLAHGHGALEFFGGDFFQCVTRPLRHGDVAETRVKRRADGHGDGGKSQTLAHCSSFLVVRSLRSAARAARPASSEEFRIKVIIVGPPALSYGVQSTTPRGGPSECANKRIARSNAVRSFGL